MKRPLARRGCARPRRSTNRVVALARQHGGALGWSDEDEMRGPGANCWCSSGEDCYETEDDSPRDNFVALRKIDREAAALSRAAVPVLRGTRRFHWITNVTFARGVRELCTRTRLPPVVYWSWTRKRTRDLAGHGAVGAEKIGPRREGGGRGDGRSAESRRKASHAVYEGQGVGRRRKSIMRMMVQPELRGVSNVRACPQPALGVTLIDAMSTLWDSQSVPTSSSKPPDPVIGGSTRWTLRAVRVRGLI